MKTCTKCGKNKPLDDFPNDRNRSDGKYPWCKQCNKEHVAKWRQTDRGKTLTKEWREKHPDYFSEWGKSEYGRERKRISQIKHQDKRRAYAQSPRGKESHRKANARYQMRNPEKRKVRAKKYYWANAERIRLRARNNTSRRKAAKYGNLGRYGKADIDQLWINQKSLCWWCGKKLDKSKFHVDHRIPLSRDGSNEPENLCLSCPKCNMSKGNKMPWEWNGRLL
jgi:5-methylcytosine-specific restriction endonuclease McrA